MDTKLKVLHRNFFWLNFLAVLVSSYLIYNIINKKYSLYSLIYR